MIAWSLAVGDVVLALLLPISQPSSTGAFDLLLLAVAAGIHVVAALTVGRRWEPGSVWGMVYLVVLVALTSIAWADSSTTTSDTFWFYLVPVGLSAISNSREQHVGVSVLALLGYVVGGVVGPGLSAASAAPRAVAISVFAAVLWFLTDQLNTALSRAELARLELERHLAEAQSVNERLTELDRMKDDFVSTASHELRTPLTVVLGFTQTLNMHWDRLDDAARRELGHRIEARAQGLAGILDTMLDTARIRRGALIADPSRVMIGEAVSGSLDRTETLLRQHELVVTGDLDVDVLADPPLLERALDNLLTNAARHTPQGTRVHLVVEREGDEVVVQVSDDGPGIEPHEVERLGEPFYRAGDLDRRTREGVGLGLALVQEVLNAHGTDLAISSEVGVGTTFSFTLPVWQPDDVEDRRPAPV